VKSDEFRSASALLTGLGTAALAALGALGCRWAPSRDWTEIHSAAAIPSGRLSPLPCADICWGTNAMGVSVRSNRCHIVEIALPEAARATPPDGGVPDATRSNHGAAPRIGVACDFHESGGPELDFSPGPYGRVPLQVARGLKTGRIDSERDHFLSVARSEAASVAAFLQLRLDLAAIGAPPSLIDAARSAARDEVVHARLALALARRYGLEPTTTVARASKPVRRMPVLVELALENALSGCVGESYGVFLHAAQSLAARDVEVRRFARRIARDESRHAALAFRLFDWLSPRLDPSDRVRIEQALLAGWGRIAGVTDMSGEVAERLGLPSSAHADAFAALTPLAAA
jgi:hypothetical protein